MIEYDWSKELIECKLIKCTLKIVEVSIYKTNTNLTTDAFHQSASASIVISTNLSISINKDFIILSYSAGATFLLGQIGCLVSPDYVLSFPAALFVASVVAFLMEAVAVSLFVSGALRLMTLATRSEASGLQLLGPDDLAIWIVRGLSVTLSFVFTTTLIFGLQILPGPFYVFHGANMSAYAFEKVEGRQGRLFILSELKLISWKEGQWVDSGWTVGEST